MAKNKKKVSAPADDWEDLPAEGGADDWQDVQEEPTAAAPVAARPQNKSSLRAMAKAGQAGVAQAMTLGYAPRLVAKGAELLSSRQPPVINPATGQPIPRVDYKTARDATYQDLANTEADSPKTFMASNFAANMAFPLGRAKSIGGAALSAALQGAAYNPGDKPGEDSGLQIPERIAGGAIGGAFGGLAKVGSDAVGAGSRAYLAKRAMNKPGFSRGVQDQIKGAVKDLNDNYVAPRAKQVTETLAGKEVSFRPDILKGTHGGPDAKGLKLFRKRLEKRAGDEAENFEVSLRGDKANRLRQVLDQRAGYSQKNSLGVPRIAARGEKQKGAADILRGKIKETAPELRDTFDEMSSALSLGSEISEKSQNPQALLTGQYFGDMGSKLVDFDKMAGSDLRGLGQDIARGRWLNGRPPSMIPHYLNEPTRRAANLGAGLSVPLSPFMDKGISPATMKLILEEIMAGKQLPEEE